MGEQENGAAAVDAFIAQFPAEVQAKLRELRAVLREEAPDAQETIAYGIPTLVYRGRNLVHFSGYQGHIGFYPGASGIEAFLGELSAYPVSRGTVRFPLNEPLPYPLIRRITRFRIEENRAKAAARTRGKKE